MVASFLVLALVALASSVLVVAARTAIHAALWLLVSLLALAGIFLVLGAEFVAAVQVVIYAGTVVVLFVFAVMTLGLGGPAPVPSRGRRAALGVLGLCILGELLWGLSSPPPEAVLAGVPETPGEEAMAGLAELLFNRWLIPLEVLSFIILAALVGAGALRRRDRSR